jgi:hypothetical protein
MTHAALLAQVTAEMPPIPPLLMGFAICALALAVVWMTVLVMHAAQEERQYKEELKRGQQNGAASSAQPKK